MSRRRRNPDDSDFPDFLPEDFPEPGEPEPRPGGMQNWPPERGPDPHAPTRTYMPGRIQRKIYEPQPVFDADQMETVYEYDVPAPPKYPLKPCPAEGSYLFEQTYRVVDIRSLSLEQAHNFLGVTKIFREDLPQSPQLYFPYPDPPDDDDDDDLPEELQEDLDAFFEEESLYGMMPTEEEETAQWIWDLQDAERSPKAIKEAYYIWGDSAEPGAGPVWFERAQDAWARGSCEKDNAPTFVVDITYP